MFDTLNGLFELCGGFAIILSIITLHKQKRVSGVSWLHVSFFTLWGFWNLFYYPHLGQWVSTACAAFVVLMNAVWLLQILYWIKKGQQTCPDTSMMSRPTD